MIVAAAIKKDNIIYTIAKPARHSDILRNYEIKNSQGQGFLTDEGIFLDRLDAAMHALNVGQIEILKHTPFLYSEDLW